MSKKHIQFFMPMKPPTVTHQEHRVTMKSGKPIFYDTPEMKSAKAKLRDSLAAHIPDKPINNGVRLMVKWLFPITGNHINGEYKLSKLLQNPEVLACIKENQKSLVDSSCLTEEKVINHLQDVLERCLSAKPVTEWDYSEHEMVETGAWTFDSKGALEAIKMLGQHLGMFSNKIKISTDGDDTLKEMMEYFEQREKENI